MQKVAPFIQLFRCELDGKDHDAFERVIVNVKCIHMVEWHENWDFVAIVCATDHPEGEETYVEDYGDPAEARKRYMHLLTLLGANDGTGMDRERLIKKTAKEHAKTDKFFRDLFQKAKEAGWDPFDEKDEDEEESKNKCEGCEGGCEECDECEYDGACNKPETGNGEKAEVNPDGGEAPTGSEGHLD